MIKLLFACTSTVLAAILFFLVVVSRSFELQKLLLSLYPSHQLFGIIQDLFEGFMASAVESKTIFEQDVSKRKQSE